MSIFNTFEFFDAAVLIPFMEHSNDLERKLDCSEAELLEDSSGKSLHCVFNLMAMDSYGNEVGVEECCVDFKIFNSKKLMHYNALIAKDYRLHGYGIDFDLARASIEITPARPEITWEEIFSINHSNYITLLEDYRVALFNNPKVNQDIREPVDEEDFCEWLLEEHDINIDRENYYDTYHPWDEHMWCDYLAPKFENLQSYLKTLKWQFNPQHKKQQILPWTISE